MQIYTFEKEASDWIQNLFNADTERSNIYASLLENKIPENYQ
jgi:hypothetical protein